LFLRFSPLAFSIALGILKSREEAEDVVQDLFTYKVPNLEAGPGGPEDMGRYLAAMARNLAIDRYRRKQRFPQVDLEPDALPEGIPEDSGRGAAMELERRMLDLKPRYREVLTLKYLLEMTWQEVAERLGLSQAGARKRARQGMQAMAKSPLIPGKDGEWWEERDE
jgi:RNA polymerase sigma-70 factor, ECF subfamily